MPDQTDTTVRQGRRTFIKGIAAAGAAASLGSVGASESPTSVVRDELSTTTAAPQEVLIVYAEGFDASRLERLGVEWYHGFESFPVVHAELTGPQLREVAGWEPVARITDNYEVAIENDDSQEDTNARAVWESEDLGYTGESVTAAVIDTGVDPTHPGIEGVLHNYVPASEPADETPRWEDAGQVNTDDYGHGTHCTGSLAGTGGGSVERDLAGMAPDASIISYEVFDEVYLYSSTVASLSGVGEVRTGVARILGSYDHLLANHADEVQLVSNSWGAGPGTFDPWDPIAVALWDMVQEGILPVFSAGNDGTGYDTLGVLKRAPFVLDVGATHADQSLADFSSRGVWDGNFDRRAALENYRNLDFGDRGDEAAIDGVQLERPSVVAKGASVMSAQSPDSALYGLAQVPLPIVVGSTEYLTEVPEHVAENSQEPLYVPVSGTSMSCPTTAGVVSLFLDAFYDEHGEFPDPIDTINTIEATAATSAHPEEDASGSSEGYNVFNVGSGYVDARAAVEAALEADDAGDLPGFDDVELAPAEPMPGEPLGNVSAAGSRDVDTPVASGGQATRVTVTLEDLRGDDPVDAVDVRDEFPAEWELLGVGDAEVVEEASTEDRTVVSFGDVAVPEGDEEDVDFESRTYEYFVESPDGAGDSNVYEIGPGSVVATFDVEEAGDAVDEFAPAEEVATLGVDI